MGVSTGSVQGISSIIYRLSNVYLSCIYRICNVVNSGRVAENKERRKREERGRNREDIGKKIDGICIYEEKVVILCGE